MAEKGIAKDEEVEENLEGDKLLFDEDEKVEKSSKKTVKHSSKKSKSSPASDEDSKFIHRKKDAVSITIPFNKLILERVFYWTVIIFLAALLFLSYSSDGTSTNSTNEDVGLDENTGSASNETGEETGDVEVVEEEPEEEPEVVEEEPEEEPEVVEEETCSDEGVEVEIEDIDTSGDDGNILDEIEVTVTNNMDEELDEYYLKISYFDYDAGTTVEITPSEGTATDDKTRYTVQNIDPCGGTKTLRLTTDNGGLTSKYMPSYIRDRDTRFTVWIYEGDDKDDEYDEFEYILNDI